MKVPPGAGRVIRIPSTPYMENKLFETLGQIQHEWASADYVCVLTYSAADKIAEFSKGKHRLDWNLLVGAARMESPPEVISLCAMVNFKSKTHRVSVLEAAVFMHGLNFYLAWHGLLRAMGFSDDEINDRSIVKGMCCNWWMAKPVHLREYIKFLRGAARKLATSPELTRLMFADAHYYSGKMTPEQRRAAFDGVEHYPVMPFVFERLPSFFFHKRGIPVTSLPGAQYTMLLK